MAIKVHCSTGLHPLPVKTWSFFAWCKNNSSALSNSNCCTEWISISIHPYFGSGMDPKKKKKNSKQARVPLFFECARFSLFIQNFWRVGINNFLLKMFSLCMLKCLTLKKKKNPGCATYPKIYFCNQERITFRFHFVRSAIYMSLHGVHLWNV